MGKHSLVEFYRDIDPLRDDGKIYIVLFYQTLERLETKLLINARDVPKIYPIPVCVISLTSFLIQTVRQ